MKDVTRQPIVAFRRTGAINLRGAYRVTRAAMLLLVFLAFASTADARLVLRNVVVRGAPKTTRGVLEARMSLHPGDEVDFGVLNDAERRLVESGLFERARVSIVMPRAEAARRMYVDGEDFLVDVEVAITEKHSWFVAPMASVGSGDYAAGVAYGDHNLFGHDLQVITAAQYGQSRSFALAGFRDPLVIGAPITWGLEALFSKEEIRFFVDHRRVLQVPTFVGGGGGEIGWVLSRHLRASLGFSGRFQRTHSAEILVSDAVLPEFNPRSGRVFILSFAVDYDSTFAPEGLRRGVRLLFRNEISDRYWGSQFDYSKFEVRTEFYGKIAWNYPSFVLRTVFNFPTSNRGVPLTEMLRIGGANLRGYLVNEFHGDTLVSAQVEDQVVAIRDLAVPLSDVRFHVALAAFMDIAALLERHPGGTAVDLPAQLRPKVSDFHTSLGAGLRFILPGVAIPPIKLDLGYGIDVRSFAVAASIAGGI